MPAARTPRRSLTAAAALLVGPALALVAGAPASAAPGAGEAPGAPGTLSHHDLARKDCLGTARTSASKVWYTVAGGVLSDVYAPYIDQSNVETLQFVVSDGTRTDLQSRDMTSTAAADATGMVCTVTSTPTSGAYTLTTAYSTDPGRNSVVMRTRLQPSDPASRLRLYVRYDASIGGHGGGGDPVKENGGADTATVDTASTALVSSDSQTLTQAVNRDYAAPLAGALLADRPFLQASSGFAGTASDGLTQLDASRTLSALTPSATAGNVVQTALLDTGGGTAGSGQPATVELALGFGGDPSAAVATAQATLATSYASLLASYTAGWDGYDARLTLPTVAGLHARGLPMAQAERLRTASVLSANVLKASEDKTFAGAEVASLASPWGQAVSAGDRPGDAPAGYFGSYREVFSRDLYEAFTGFLADGDLATARDLTTFLFDRQQQADGRLPRNSLLNGKVAPDTGGDQLDETAYPLLMAVQSGLSISPAFYAAHIKPAADFVVARGPSFGSERWEEQSGYSPSTIAAEIAGLVAAAQIATAQGDVASARTFLATADDFARSIKGQTVTTTGPYGSGRYFLRLSKAGDPNAAVSFGLGNGGPTVDQRSVLDQGFLELSRLGILPASDPDITATLPLIDSVIGRTTPSGQGFYRYGTNAPGSEDGYGDDAATGRPWPTTNTGTGHLWPVLSGERAEHSLAIGDTGGAATLLGSMDAYASGVGLVPEQDWEDAPLAASPAGTPPEQASIGFAPGRPIGSAAPLTWAQAQELRLAITLAGATPQVPVEQPRFVARRYASIRGGAPRALPLTITAPTGSAPITTTTTLVSGTTAPRATVDVSVTDTDTGAPTTRTTITASTTGAFSVTVPIGFGTNVITLAALAGENTATPGTAHASVTVTSDLVPGTTVLDLTDPTGDDHGPGTFAYPKADAFHPGAFDITRFQVIDAGDTTFLRTQVRDLSPTFGDPLGAQLLTVYVHDPAAAGTTTRATYADRNYTIAPQDAWSRAVQVRGFASPQYTRADGSSAGTVTAQASAASGYITIAVPTASLGGRVGPGWTFSVAMWSQDGYGHNGARDIDATPSDYTLGVCAAGVDDPRCSLDPKTAPNVMDTLTPAGVEQSRELDATRGPVVLRGVGLTAPTPVVPEFPLAALAPLVALALGGLLLGRSRRRTHRAR